MGFDIVKSYTKISEPNSSNAIVIAEDLAQAYVDEKIDSIEIVTTRFRNMMFIAWKIGKFFLLVILLKKHWGAKVQESAKVDPLMAFEPDVDHILQKIVPMFITNIIYQALLEAVASELAARMTAMSSATNNAAEMIRILTIDLHPTCEETSRGLPWPSDRPVCKGPRGSIPDLLAKDAHFSSRRDCQKPGRRFPQMMEYSVDASFMISKVRT